MMNQVMKKTIKCNDSDEIVVRLPVMFFGFSLFCFLPNDLPGLLVLLRNASSLFRCSTDINDNDINAVHVYDQSAYVLI
jgi:hypothetical protein